MMGGAIDDVLVFRFDIEAARALSVAGQSGKLQFFRDPDGVVDASRPGAAGHLGLQGLGYKRPGEESEPIAKKLRILLADLCRPAALGDTASGVSPADTAIGSG